MHASTEEFVAILEQKDIKYTYEGQNESSRKDRLKIRFRGDNVETIEITFFLSEDCEDAAVRVFDLVKVPANKVPEMLVTINEQNNRFRFAKFCLDTDDNTVQAEIDVPFRVGAIGEVCFEVMGRILNICDDAYPALMKTIYA